MTISLSSFVQFFPLFQKVSLEERVRKKEIRDDYIYIYIYIRDTEFIIDYTRHERRGEERRGEENSASRVRILRFPRGRSITVRREESRIRSKAVRVKPSIGDRDERSVRSVAALSITFCPFSPAPGYYDLRGYAAGTINFN